MKERILGIDFFNGDATQAIELFQQQGGLLVIPPAPALTKLRHDQGYRQALQGADVALLDSNLVAAAWRTLTGRPIRNVSSIDYLKTLLRTEAFQRRTETLWIVNSEDQRAQTLRWLADTSYAAGSDRFHIIANGQNYEDHALLLQIEDQRPEHILIGAIGGGQEKLGLYLRDYLLYRPCIHCVGSALALLTGVERAIPDWAGRARLGWLVRLGAQPRMILPRVGIAITLLILLLRNRSKAPSLQPRWADV